MLWWLLLKQIFDYISYEFKYHNCHDSLRIKVFLNRHGKRQGCDRKQQCVNLNYTLKTDTRLCLPREISVPRCMVEFLTNLSKPDLFL